MKSQLILKPTGVAYCLLAASVAISATASAETLERIATPSGQTLELSPVQTKSSAQNEDAPAASRVHALDGDLNGRVHVFGEEATGLVEENGKWYYLHTRDGKAVYEPAATMPPVSCGVAHDDEAHAKHLVRPPLHTPKAHTPKAKAVRAKQNVDRNGHPEQPGAQYKPVLPPGWDEADEERVRRQIDARHPGDVSMDDPVPEGYTELRVMAYAANDYVAWSGGVASVVLNQISAFSLANQVLENTGIDAEVKLAGVFPINFTTASHSNQDEESPRDDFDIIDHYHYAQWAPTGFYRRFSAHGLMFLGGALRDPNAQHGSADLFRNPSRYSTTRMWLNIPFATSGPFHARVVTHELGHTWGGGHHPNNPDAVASFIGAFASECGRLPTLTNDRPELGKTMITRSANHPRYSRDGLPHQGVPCGDPDKNVYKSVARVIPFYRNLHLPKTFDGEISMDHEVTYTRNEVGEVTGGTATITATRSGSASAPARFFVIIGGVRGLTDDEVDTQHFREVRMDANERTATFTVDFSSVRDHDTGQAIAYMAQGGVGVATDVHNIGFIPVPPLPTDERLFFDGLDEQYTTMRAIEQMGER